MVTVAGMVMNLPVSMRTSCQPPSCTFQTRSGWCEMVEGLQPWMRRFAVVGCG